jgi:hypothetical protein
MGVTVCGEHFIRAGTDSYCDLPTGHNGDHGLQSDFKPIETEQEEMVAWTVSEQRSVFEEALAIHAARTGTYGLLWQEDAPLDQSFLVKHKAKRLNKVLLDAHVRGEDPDPGATAEAALDLINYAGFILRLVRNG